MPRRAYRIWSKIESALGGVTIKPALRRSWEDEFSESEIEVIAQELPLYLADYPGQPSVTVVHTLGKMIRSGEWGHPEAPALVEPEPEYAPITLGSQPWIDDSLVRAMPPLVQAMVAARIQGTGICVDYGIAGALATLAGVCGNRLRFTAWGGDSYFPNLYIVLVGDTGKSYKSSVGKWVKALISEVNPQALAADESSVEAMIRDLSERPSRLWIQDEFAGLISSMKNRDYMRPVRELLLSLFDHMGVYRRRLMRADFAATNPALSMLTTIQPAVMGSELFANRNVDSGFVNRLLMVYGEAQNPYWPKIEDYSYYRHQIIEQLRHLDRQPAVTCFMPDDAIEVAQQWVGNEEATFGEYGKWVATRSGIQALKIAALLEAAEGWPGGRNVPVERVHVATALLERWYRKSVALIAEHHLKQPGELDRREFFKLACGHTHNGTGPVRIGVLQSEMQCGKRQAEGWQDDLMDRGWLRPDDEQNIVCTTTSPLCGAKA